MAAQNIRHDRVSALLGAPVPGKMEYVPVDGSYLLYLTDNTGTRRPPAVMAHGHSISDVTGLQAALDGKAPLSHIHANATTSSAGFMSAADKIKLDASVNYTHPASGVTAGTYRSVTVNTQGHVTGGTNPETLADYGITERYVSLGANAGYVVPDSGTVDLNSISVTSEGYVSTGTGRPTGQAAPGYISTRSTGSTSAFQTWFNPADQDAFFYRRKNASTNYNWLQVASREWVSGFIDTRWIAQFGTGTDLNTRPINGGVDAYGAAANAPSTYGTIFTFVGGSATGNSVSGSWNNQIIATTGQDWFVRTGGSTWNPTYQMWTSRQFTSANVSNWNTAFGWNNHALAGYLTSSTGISSSRAVNTGSGLTGGGPLSIDRTISVVYGNTVGTVAQGNDQRINNGQISYERWAGGTGTGQDFNERAGITGITGWAPTAANRPGNSYGTIFRFIAGTFTGEAVSGSWVNELMAGTGQDWYVRTGGGNGVGNGVNWNPIYQVWTSRQFTGSNIAQWNAATSNTGTVTQVGLVVPTGFNVTSSPVTGSGNVSFEINSAYFMPTLSSKSAWDQAWQWGNHASQGYLKSINSGNVTGALGYTPLRDDRTITINGFTQNLRDNPNYNVIGYNATITINGSTQNMRDNPSFSVSGGVSGSGASNYLTRWNSANNALTYSRIFDDGSSEMQIYSQVRVQTHLTVGGVLNVFSTLNLSSGLALQPRLESQLNSIPGLQEGMIAYVARDNGSGGVASGHGLWCYYGSVIGWRILSTRVWSGGGGAP
ncbi:hypothetical protein [Dyadobacter sp. CY312]|uniref:hypothetical protein n=1 Tax=Dyadobacter sp. CY312 TaxID=2907303 RepID=UPI001F3F4D06|nr:hypothetical protein [Dyadobacter sp. CY312]MCE7038999.1 hypothetical protein [Dyadobacter sp. CY312]